MFRFDKLDDWRAAVEFADVVSLRVRSRQKRVEQ